MPENPVNISLAGNTEPAVRLVDCVGYMVDGAAGQFEDGEERMVTTPWFDHEISMTEAAEKGTYKVITEHSTIGIVITTDGSICDIPREKYLVPEERVINELKEIGKPFIVLRETCCSCKLIRLKHSKAKFYAVFTSSYKSIAVFCS